MVKDGATNSDGDRNWSLVDATLVAQNIFEEYVHNLGKRSGRNDRALKTFWTKVCDSATSEEDRTEILSHVVDEALLTFDWRSRQPATLSAKRLNELRCDAAMVLLAQIPVVKLDRHKEKVALHLSAVLQRSSWQDVCINFDSWFGSLSEVIQAPEQRLRSSLVAAYSAEPGDEKTLPMSWRSENSEERVLRDLAITRMLVEKRSFNRAALWFSSVKDQLRSCGPSNEARSSAGQLLREVCDKASVFGWSNARDYKDRPTNFSHLDLLREIFDSTFSEELSELEDAQIVSTFLSFVQVGDFASASRVEIEANKWTGLPFSNLFGRGRASHLELFGTNRETSLPGRVLAVLLYGMHSRGNNDHAEIANAQTVLVRQARLAALITDVDTDQNIIDDLTIGMSFDDWIYVAALHSDKDDLTAYVFNGVSKVDRSQKGIVFQEKFVTSIELHHLLEKTEHDEAFTHRQHDVHPSDLVRSLIIASDPSIDFKNMLAESTNPATVVWISNEMLARLCSFDDAIKEVVGLNRYLNRNGLGEHQRKFPYTELKRHLWLFPTPDTPEIVFHKLGDVGLLPDRWDELAADLLSPFGELGRNAAAHNHPFARGFQWLADNALYGDADTDLALLAGCQRMLDFGADVARCGWDTNEEFWNHVAGSAIFLGEALRFLEIYRTIQEPLPCEASLILLDVIDKSLDVKLLGEISTLVPIDPTHTRRGGMPILTLESRRREVLEKFSLVRGRLTGGFVPQTVPYVERERARVDELNRRTADSDIELDEIAAAVETFRASKAQTKHRE